jgi:hypothetical protein
MTEKRRGREPMSEPEYDERYEIQNDDIKRRLRDIAAGIEEQLPEAHARIRGGLMTSDELIAIWRERAAQQSGDSDAAAVARGTLLYCAQELEESQGQVIVGELLTTESDWQPISEDERNGDRILVAVPGTDGPHDVVIVRWDRDPEEECGQCWRTDDDERISFEPTLFQALPAHPHR